MVVPTYAFPLVWWLIRLNPLTIHGWNRSIDWPLPVGPRSPLTSRTSVASGRVARKLAVST